MSPESLAGTCVVIPTYNEAANLERLVAALRALGGLRLIVIDDKSPDGTGELATRLAASDPALEVILRPGKAGRGSAVLAGFSAALRRPEVRYVAEMDADFSHNPRELPEMVEALSRGGIGMVVRSRYAPGSSIVDWGLGRTVFSRAANVLARGLLAAPLSDYTNGYRAYAREALEALDQDKIEASGYIVLSEVACQLHAKGFRCLELPTVFVNRRRGESNLTCREVAGAARGLLRLWRRRGP